MAFSNLDVQKHRNKRIVIEPFTEENLTPAGYDLSLGYALLLSSEEGLISEIDYKSYMSNRGVVPKVAPPFITVPGKSDVLVITRERIHLSGKVLAQVHARSGITAKGFLLNPLTVDPNFGNGHGRLFLRFYNFTNEDAKLSINETVATLVFHSAETETDSKPLTYTQEMSLNKYRHIPHVRPAVDDYLEAFGSNTDEGELQFQNATEKLIKFRNHAKWIRRLMLMRDELTWSGLKPFFPLALFDLGAWALKFFPSIMNWFGVSAETVHSPSFIVSVLAANLAYAAFTRTLAK
jgi:deoxycytidine triphosphate deaminase